MTSLLNSLRNSLSSCCPVDFEEPKNYELEVIDEILTLRDEYRNSLE